MADRMSDALESHLVHERRNRPPGPSPVDLVSVQSQLAYGHAGNSAAIPVLRMLGVRVAGVPTTLLSNTPFYPTLRGRVLPAEWLAELLQGLDERGVSTRVPMLLSGYFGSVANGAAFAGWLEAHHRAGTAPRYLLDPAGVDGHAQRIRTRVPRGPAGVA
jgi:pyridoxine kinase